MPKVLIIGPDFYNFNISVSNAFKALGWEAVIESYDVPVHPFKGLVRWRHKFAVNKEKLRHRQNLKYKYYIETCFNEVKPDFVFILNGDILQASSLDFFRSNAKTALWLFDSINNLPSVKNYIDHIDYCFCYDKEDVDFYSGLGKKAYFLPQAYDPAIYYPESGIIKDIDILFVGNLYLSPRRQHYIKNVIQAFSDRKIVIIGEYKPWYKNPIKWFLREHKNIYTNRNIPYLEVNNYYNKAKLVLNIHNEQQKNGANPRVFEIGGSGAYQLCDTNPYIEHLFRHNEVGLFENEKDLIGKIQYALSHDTDQNAQNAYEIVFSRHTFKQRIQEVLNICYKN